jgi:hypothetical protein
VHDNSNESNAPELKNTAKWIVAVSNILQHPTEFMIGSNILKVESQS